jgi:NADH:ubiquinone oxidoreductase subunit K
MSDATTNRFCYAMLTVIFYLNVGGLFQPNYRQDMNLVQELISIKKELNNYAVGVITETISKPVKSFEPTNFGLYSAALLASEAYLILMILLTLKNKY